MAEASGLQLLTLEERDALNTCTYGTGELINAALDAGAQTIILTVGGKCHQRRWRGYAPRLGRLPGE